MHVQLRAMGYAFRSLRRSQGVQSPKSWSSEACRTFPALISAMASHVVFTSVQPSGAGRSSSSHMSILGADISTRIGRSVYIRCTCTSSRYADDASLYTKKAPSVSLPGFENRESECNRIGACSFRRSHSVRPSRGGNGRQSSTHSLHAFNSRCARSEYATRTLGDLLCQ